MADKIKITTADLESQAVRLSGLSNQMEDICSKADRALSLMEDALSSKFTSNMDKKGKTLLKNLKTLKSSLNTGAKVATQCATSYQNADKVLRDVIGDSLPEDIKNSSTSSQTVENPVANFLDLPIEKVGYSGPCNMAATANLLNRRKLLDGTYNSDTHISWEDIKSINSGSDSAKWTGALKSGIKNNYNYDMIYDNGAHIKDVNYIKNLLSEHPEGVLIYETNMTYTSNGKVYNDGAHGVVLSMQNGQFYITDSSTGATTLLSESWTAKTYGLNTIEKLLSKTKNLYYIA